MQMSLCLVLEGQSIILDSSNIQQHEQVSRFLFAVPWFYAFKFKFKF